MTKGQVSADDILKGAQDIKVQTLAPKERAALHLSWAVGGLIVIITIALGGHWLLTVPPPPVLPLPTGAVVTPADDAITQHIEQYRALNEVVLNRTTSLFDVLVARTLLPVFLAIAGFIFGTRVAGDSDRA